MVIETAQGADFTYLKYTGTTPTDTIGTIQCSTIDGGTTGIRVAMPWLLRSASYDGKTIDTVTYSFTSSFEREASPASGTDWTENLFMSYNVGDIITVLSNDGLITDISDTVEIPYVEVSNNRIWGRACP